MMSCAPDSNPPSASCRRVPPATNPWQKIVEDVAAAQRLLADAGYHDGKDFPALSILFNTTEANRAIAEAIQAMWQKNLHINVTLQNMEARCRRAPCAN